MGIHICNRRTWGLRQKVCHRFWANLGYMGDFTVLGKKTKKIKTVYD